jgi:hypothetical protein
MAFPVIKLVSLKLYQIVSDIGKGNTIFFVASVFGWWYKFHSIAEVVELVDTQDSGSCARKGVLVRVQSSAPKNQGFSATAENPFFCTISVCSQRSSP